MSTPRFVNLQPGKVTVPGPDHRSIVVLPYYPGASNTLGQTYILEGEAYRDFVSDKGPLYPFPEAPAAVDAPGTLRNIPVMSSTAPVGKLIHPNLAAAYQASAQSAANSEAQAAGGEGPNSGEDASGEGDGSGTRGPEAPAQPNPVTEDDEDLDDEDLDDEDLEDEDLEDEDEEDGDTPPADAVTVEGEAEERTVNDLTLVKHIGAQTEEALNMAGIYTFAALAAAPTSILSPLMRDGIISQVQQDAAAFAASGDPYAKPSLRDRAR